MAKGDVVSVKTRKETTDEAALREWFNEQELGSIENLEAGARQIIQLITALFGVVFGVVALGSDSLEPSLRHPVAIIASGAVIVILLLALGAALFVVLPQEYQYRDSSLSDKKDTFRKIRRRKVRALKWAELAFFIGICIFAFLIAVMLYLR